MKTEREVKFLWIDKNFLREQLIALGGVCTAPERVMKRVTYDAPAQGAETYFRVRDEGDRCTFTLKCVDRTKWIDGVQELEVAVSEFTTLIEILRRLWFAYKSYQETKREERVLPQHIHIMIDEWPWLRPFVEIEGETQEKVQEAAVALGFFWEDGLFGTVDVVAQKELGLDPGIVNWLPEITFEKPLKKGMMKE